MFFRKLIFSIAKEFFIDKILTPTRPRRRNLRSYFRSEMCILQLERFLTIVQNYRILTLTLHQAAFGCKKQQH